jgi:iron(III) transport system substrate-binding protein
MKFIQAAALLLLAFMGSANAQSDAEWAKVIEAGRKEGKVVWYTGQTANPSHKEFVRTFEQKYGIRIELLDGRTTEIRERVRSEQAAGRFSGDVYHDGRTAMALMRQEGLLQPLGQFPNAKNMVPPYALEEYSVPTHDFSYGILINRNLVKPGDEPKSWKDVLDPKWRGKILADDVRTLGGGATFFKVMFETFGRDYHEAFSKQDVMFSRDIRNSELRVARGEYPIFLPMAISYYTRLKELPVKLIVPNEGRPYGIFEIALLKGSPRPNAARLLINHLLEFDSQLVLANLGYGPVVKGVVERADNAVREYLVSPALGTMDTATVNETLDLAKQMYK